MMRLLLTPDEAKELRNFRETAEYDSGFGFLKDHSGYRRGQFHLFVGTKGSGKSSLTRGLILDFIEHNSGDDVLVYLSEDGVQDFRVDWAHAPLVQSYSSIYVYSEQDDERLWKNPFLFLEEYIEEHKPKLVVIDNITTMGCYMDSSAKDQSSIAKSIKKLAYKHNIPIVLIAHTAKGVTDNGGKLIDGDDIRGSRNITNLAPFLYVIQTFRLPDSMKPTLRVEKARGYSPGKVYALMYNKNFKLIEKSPEIDYEIVKSFNKARIRV